jgi:glutamate synthase (NADPH/NADH) large chain
MSQPNDSAPAGRPGKQGLYDPWFEHDACGVGFIADMKGRKSHQMVADGLQILRNLDHRGASGAEINTGDGAGILIQIPHKFFAEGCKAALRFTLPEAGQYGVGLIFLPRNPTVRRKVEESSSRSSRPRAAPSSAGAPCRSRMHHSVTLRSPPSRSCASASSPAPMASTSWASSASSTSSASAPTRVIRTSTLAGAEAWYVASLSARTLVYKGMLTTDQVDQYFPT